MSTTSPAPRQMLSPFPYFGGKSRVALLAWAALAGTTAYIEPFAGSAATWLACPDEQRSGIKRVILNDADAFVANFWRAAREQPHEIARLCDGPLDEAELLARHRWLCDPERRAELARQVKASPEFFDVQAAAYWCYGMSGWIGGGFACGDYHGPDDPRTRGTGLRTSKLPHMSSFNGVFSGRVTADIAAYFARLHERLARSTILCGDWSRAVGRYTAHLRGPIGVLLDPPYAAEADRAEVYRVEDLAVSHDVRRWAIEACKSDPRRWRIVLCGYEGEHPADELSAAGWTTLAWSAQGGYGNRTPRDSARKGQVTRGQVNRHRERLWLSPGCVVPTAEQLAELCKSARVIEHPPAPAAAQYSRKNAARRAHRPAVPRSGKGGAS